MGSALNLVPFFVIIGRNERGVLFHYVEKCA